MRTTFATRASFSLIAALSVSSRSRASGKIPSRQLDADQRAPEGFAHRLRGRPAFDDAGDGRRRRGTTAVEHDLDVGDVLQRLHEVRERAGGGAGNDDDVAEVRHRLPSCTMARAAAKE